MILFFLIFLIPLIFGFNSFAQDSNNVYVAPDVNIISVTPVQGAGVSIDRVPSNIQSILEE